MEILKIVLLVIGSYLLGSINFARILSGKMMHSDITKSGSGNPGTMNMLRTYGFKAGILTLLLDALKGVIPALAGYFLFGGGGTEWAYTGLYIAGISATVGHCFPVYYGFKGGKGVACVFGVFAVARPLAVLIVFVIAFIYLAIFDYASVASFIFLTTLTVVEGIRFRGNLTISFLLFAIFFLVWFMHRQNIFRLLIGKENKVHLLSKLRKKNKNNNNQ